jgi:hypothetical protein
MALVFSLLSSLMRKIGLQGHIMSVCLYVSLSTFKLLINFHEIWYEHYAIKDYGNIIVSNFLQSVIKHGRQRNL